MARNPLGFVQANDFGNPRVLTGEAMEVISGGNLVGVSGTTGVVSSGLNSYVNSDVKFINCDDSENFVGVAMQTASSGAELAVAIDTLALLRCGGSVFAGRLIKAISGIHAVSNLGSQAVPSSVQDSSIAGNIAGRAMTQGASGGFALVHIK